MYSLLSKVWFSFYFFAQSSQCERDPFHRNCYQDADLEAIFGIDLSSNSAPLELTLSPELAMLTTYILKFLVFHFVGLALCWICTIRFRT